MRIFLFLLLASVAQAQYVSPGFNGGAIVSTTYPGWQFAEDIFGGANLGSTGAFCTSGTKCTINLSGVTSSSAKSAWMVGIATTNNVTIARVCTNDTTCASGNDNWTLCATSGCHENNGSLNPANEDLAYNVNGTVSSTSFTIVLSGTSGATFVGWFFEYLPPSGFTPVLDGVAVATSASCSTCTMAAPTVTGTDVVFHMPNPTQIQASAVPPSSPYIQNWDGNVFGLNITSSTAPTFAQSSGAFMDSAISFKTTAAFTADAKASLYTLVNMANPGFAGTGCDSTTGCTITIPSTGSGHLLFMAVGNQSGHHIASAVDSASNSWTVPTGANTCQIALTGIPNNVLSCAYLLSSTNATTSVTMKAEAGSTNFGVIIYEISRSSGSFVLDAQGSQQNTASGSYPGVAPSLSGSTDVIFAGYFCPGGCNTISYYPISATNLNSGNGPNPSQNYLSAGVINSILATAPTSGGNNQATTATYIAFK